jgi:hypothetical protein
MTVQSPTDLYPQLRGKTVDSFARRAAAANHTTVTNIKAGLRQHHLLTSRARSSHQRGALWRQLGPLPHHAFTACPPPVSIQVRR